MQLTQSKLKQFINKELTSILSEGDVIEGPWGEYEDLGDLGGASSSPELEPPEDDEYSEELNAPKYQLQDILVNAAQQRILYKFRDANKVGEGPGQMTENNIEHKFEIPLMEIMLPVAAQFADQLWPIFLDVLDQFMKESVTFENTSFYDEPEDEI